MKLDIIRQRSFWWLISGLLILASLIGMVLCWQQFNAPLRPGLDFVGGTRIQVSRDCAIADCTEPIQPAQVRDLLAQEGLETSVIQVTGDDGQSVAIRTRNLTVDEETILRADLEESIGPLDGQSIQIDSVGPTVGQQLFASGLLALLVSFAGIVIYLSLRFQLDYAVLAIVALLHDVLITMGLFAWLGLLLKVEVNSLFIVSLLTVVGFSVNDTVVIYDRIRENIKLHPERHINDLVDDGVNQTLTRSINTTLTTVLPLIAIVFFGGDTLKFFALALIAGFLAGAYSSIFIASTLLAWWRVRSGRAIAGSAEPPQPTGEVSNDVQL
ncbi:protein translocase subunit SecF [Oscillatoria sp. CS-180]|uniref:protein translocase subunit SecF n=1 Tax=Oscillatoria sp. CS-180 TaxID=3021720 RepID=UPI00232CB81F|nr:protein translocase subunit SecF [Oscillatoria sp. CS-180]MDB9528347.1 protein translocase subunit SecF [Oscillatoria sp. CS-180]